MEESPQLQKVTLNPSETAFIFPHHGRRPLRSRTYRALVGILSHTRSDFSHLQVQGVALTEADVGDFKYRSVCIENESTSNEVSSVDVLVPHNNSKVLDDSLVQETTTSEKKENFCFQDGGSDGKSTTEPQVDHMDVVRDGEHEVAPANKISGNFLEAQKQMGDCAIDVAKDQENGNMKNVSDIPMVMSDFGTVAELEVDNEFCIDDFSEVLDSCFGMDMVVDSSKAEEEGQENRTFLEDSMPKKAEYELQLKEMELEKLIHNSDEVELSCQLNAGDEIEEGEISGDAGFANSSFDVLSEDASSMGERKTQLVHAYEDSITKEHASNDEDRGLRRHEISDPWLVNVVNSHTDPMKVESRTPVQKMQEYHSQNVFNDIDRETTKKVGPQDTRLENLTPPGRILQEDAADNQCSDTTEKDQDANKKKRKRCPLTKERRAKKKKNERIKRAEKNRKLGVKRLKLQPVTKPKKIVYCRHFLQGRCHEGEKCNFSHDTVPLTKSKPCGHFARHSCMKGDDCPFDHQLSKYPCLNYTSNGFCSRGSDCLFSHEMPAKQSSSITPNASAPELTSGQHTVPDKERSIMISQVTKPELKLPLSLKNLTTSKHTDNRGISHQKNDAKLCLVGSSPGKSAELHPGNPVLRTAGKVPRGVTFLNGGTSSADSSKQKRDGPSVTTTDGVDVGGKTIPKVPVSPNKLNEMSKRAAPRKPRGINFLSFAQPSSDDSSSKIISNFPLNSNNETGKSVMHSMNESKLLPESDEILRVNRQMNQSPKDLVQKLNQNSNQTPLTPYFLSFNKTRLDDSILKETAIQSDKGDSAPPFVKERQTIANKIQDTFQMPSLPLGSPSTSGQHTNFSSSFKPSLLSNTPSVVQKAIQSTLAFAEKFEPDIRVGSSLHQCRN